MIRRLPTSLLTIVAIVPVVTVVCQAAQPLTHHVRDVVSSGQARQVGRLPATQSMRLVMVLPHSNEAELQSLLQQIYDPSSPNYEQYFTVEEFTSRFGPSQPDALAHLGTGQLFHPETGRPEQKYRLETVERHHRLRPLGFVPGQRHAGGLLRRNADRQRPIVGLLEYYGTDLADLQTYYTNAARPTMAASSLCFHRRHQHQLRGLEGRRRLRRHRADAGYDAGAGHGAGTIGPGHVRGLDRLGHLQRHGDASPLREPELFVDLEPGRPQHRRSVLEGVCGAGPEPVSGRGRQRQVGRRSFGDLIRRTMSM
jgi:hypothetical protein